MSFFLLLVRNEVAETARRDCPCGVCARTCSVCDYTDCVNSTLTHTHGGVPDRTGDRKMRGWYASVHHLLEVVSMWDGDGVLCGFRDGRFHFSPGSLSLFYRFGARSHDLFEQLMCSLVGHRYPRLVRLALHPWREL